MRPLILATLLTLALAASCCAAAGNSLAGGAMLKNTHGSASADAEEPLAARAVCTNSTGDYFGTCSSTSLCCETATYNCCQPGYGCCYDRVGGCCPLDTTCCDDYCCRSDQICVAGTCENTSPLVPGALYIGTLITCIILILLNIAFLINNIVIHSRCRLALARISLAGPQWSPNCGITFELYQVATTRVFLRTVRSKRRFAAAGIAFHVLSLVCALLALIVLGVLVYPAYVFGFIGLMCSIACSCMRGASHDQLRRLAVGGSAAGTAVVMTSQAQPQAVPVATVVVGSAGVPLSYAQAQYAPPASPHQAPYPAAPYPGAPYPPQQGPYPPQQPPQQGPYPPQQPPQQGPYPPQQGPYPPQQGPYPPQQGPYPPQQAPYPPAAYAPGYEPNAPPPSYDAGVPHN